MCLQEADFPICGKVSSEMKPQRGINQQTIDLCQ